MRPLRLLFITSVKFWGGGEQWMLSTCLGLRTRGHHGALVCQPGSQIERRAQATGLHLIPLRIRGDLDPHTIWRLLRLIRAERADLVCVNRDKETRLAGVAARLAGVPLVKRRGSDYPFPDKRRFRWTYKYLVSRIIVNSEATEQTLLRGNPWLDPEKVVMIYNGIDPEAYRPRREQTSHPPVPPTGREGEGETGQASPPPAREEGREGGSVPCDLRAGLGLPSDAPVIGIIGLLTERKGHRPLLRAFKGLLEDLPDARLLVVGEGWMRPELEEMAINMGIGSHVLFLGLRDDIPDVLDALDLLILPSFREGFGYVLIEAMAAGKPVVATRTSSIPEIVEDGATGLLVPPGDPSALRGAIHRLLCDPALARRMGQTGRRVVADRFHIDRMLDQVEELFQKTVIEP